MNEEVVIITYYWPPSGGAGVHRWLELSNYLQKFGKKVTVITTKNPDYPVIDENLKQKVNSSIEVIKIGGFEPRNWLKKLIKKDTNFDNSLENKHKQSAIQKLIVYIRGNFFIPDARLGWAKSVKKYLQKNSSFLNNKTIITTGPPHSTHLSVLPLKENKRHDFKWIVDFRDPWSEIEYFDDLRLTHKSKAKHEKLEKSVLRNADLALTVSPSWKVLLEDKGAKNCKVAYNATDIPFQKEKKFNNKFTISYLGTLKADRIPAVFLKIMAKIVQENTDFAKKLELKFIGNISPELKQTIKNYELTEKSKFTGFKSHEVAVDEIFSADLLLLLQNKSEKNADGRIPMKFFEYVKSLNQIFILGNTSSDLSKISSELKGCFTCNYEDEQKIFSYLTNSFKNYSEQKTFDRSKSTLTLSREKVAKELSELI